MKNNRKLTLLFWHRKSMADVNGFAPIICRLSIDANEEEFSIGRKVHLNDWNAKYKKAKGDSEGKKTNQIYLP